MARELKIPEDAIKSYFDHIIDDYGQFQSVTTGIERSNPERIRKVREEMFERFKKGLTYEVGNKYIKIVCGNTEDAQCRVHSFIVNTDKDKKFKLGDILKPAGWKMPTRNAARGNLFEDYDVSWTGPHYL